MPTSKDTLAVKSYSASNISKAVKVTSESANSELLLENISGFVTCVVESEDPLVTVTFLHPHGPCSSFRYPKAPDVHTLITRDILTSVDPRSRTGRVYTLTKSEIKSASERLTKLL